MWVLDHLEDLESDFAVFHRVADPLALPGPEFFRKALRLSAYDGVMTARVVAAQKDSGPGRPAYNRSRRAERTEVPLSQVMAQHPDLIDRSTPGR